MKTKQQNIEIPEETFAWYAANFPTARQGITSATAAFMDSLDKNPVAKMFADPLTAHEFLMGAWKQMWRHSLVSLKGVFTKSELCLIIDIYNGTMLSAWHYGSDTLAAQVSDSIALDSTAEKWEVSPDQISGKIKNLNPIQALCMEIFANGFWYGKKAQEKDIPADGLETYINQLL